MDLITLVETVRRRTRLFEHETNMIHAACARYAAALGFEDPLHCPAHAYVKDRATRDALIEERLPTLSKRQRAVTKTLLARLFSRASALGLVDLDEPPVTSARAGKSRVADSAAVAPPEGLPFIGADGELPEGTGLQDVLDAVQRHFITRALEQSASQSEAAERLGMPFNTLASRMRRLGLYG